jgi:hypothetical protein
MLLIVVSKQLTRQTVEKTKKHRRDKKTKITAAFITDIAAVVKSDRRQTIRHITLALGGLLKTSFTQYFSKN